MAKIITPGYLKKLLSGPNHLLLSAPRIEDAELMLEETLQSLGPKGGITRVEIRPDEKNKIGIAAIREFRSAVKMNHQNDRLYVTIHSAHLMTVEAQNSLLKVLEDSPKGVYFLLAARQSGGLLGTVASRFIKVDYQPPKITDLSSREKEIYRASGYSMALLQAYKNADHSNNLSQAKAWLQADRLARIKQANQLKDRAALEDLIEAVVAIYFSLLHRQAKAGDRHQVKQIIEAIDSCLVNNRRLRNGVSQKLIIAQLAMTI